MYGTCDLFLSGRVWQKWWNSHFCVTLHCVRLCLRLKSEILLLALKSKVPCVKGLWEDHMAGICGGVSRSWEHPLSNACVCSVTQLCLTICDPMDCSLPGFSVHGIFLARILERVAISFSRGSSQSRDWTHTSCTAGKFFTDKPPGKSSYLIASRKMGPHSWSHKELNSANNHMNLERDPELQKETWPGHHLEYTL